MNKKLQNLIWTPSVEDLHREREFIAEQIKEIGEDKIVNLIGTSLKYRENANPLYSNYKVGAVLLTIDGNVYGECNNEYVSYSPTDHAEGTAITKAVSEGESKKDRKFIKAIAVTHNGDSGPCGECLQRIVEHADNCLIIIADSEGKIRRITSLLTIFPYNFNPTHLGK